MARPRPTNSQRTCNGERDLALRDIARLRRNYVNRSGRLRIGQARTIDLTGPGATATCLAFEGIRAADSASAVRAQNFIACRGCLAGRLFFKRAKVGCLADPLIADSGTTRASAIGRNPGTPRRGRARPGERWQFRKLKCRNVGTCFGQRSVLVLLCPGGQDRHQLSLKGE